MLENLVVRCSRSLWNFRDGVDLFFWQLGVDRVAIVEPLKMRSLPLEDARLGQAVSPVLTLDMTAAQKLMDELWTCGLRPTEGAGSAGALAATQRHLEDCRKLLAHAWAPLELGPLKP